MPRVYPHATKAVMTTARPTTEMQTATDTVVPLTLWSHVTELSQMAIWTTVTTAMIQSQPCIKEHHVPALKVAKAR